MRRLRKPYLRKQTKLEKLSQPFLFVLHPQERSKPRSNHVEVDAHAFEDCQLAPCNCLLTDEVWTPGNRVPIKKV